MGLSGWTSHQLNTTIAICENSPRLCLLLPLKGCFGVALAGSTTAGGVLGEASCPGAPGLAGVGAEVAASGPRAIVFWTLRWRGKRHPCQASVAVLRFASAAQ